MSQPRSKLSRRTLFAGTATVGALTAAATLLPGVVQPQNETTKTEPPPSNGGGYRLSEHVKRYYRSTRI